MSKPVSPELQQEITALFSDTLTKLAENHADSYSELLSLWQKLHLVYLETVAETLENWAERYGSPAIIDKIEADSVTIEVVDKNTGRIFRRSLPVRYFESNNGLFLSGETLEGNPSQIAFFSDAAISRLRDLSGKGPDRPCCKHD